MLELKKAGYVGARVWPNVWCLDRAVTAPSRAVVTLGVAIDPICLISCLVFDDRLVGC